MVKLINYQIIIERRAKKEAEKIPSSQREKIDSAIVSLSNNPRPPMCKKLTQKEGYRIRVGNYRILYTVDDKNKKVIIYRIKIRDKSTYK